MIPQIGQKIALDENGMIEYGIKEFMPNSSGYGYSTKQKYAGNLFRWTVSHPDIEHYGRPLSTKERLETIYRLTICNTKVKLDLNQKIRMSNEELLDLYLLPDCKSSARSDLKGYQFKVECIDSELCTYLVTIFKSSVKPKKEATGL